MKIISLFTGLPSLGPGTGASESGPAAAAAGSCPTGPALRPSGAALQGPGPRSLQPEW